MTSLEPGVTINDRYQLEKKLGEGGMGAVWAASHLITKKKVALKFLKAGDTPSEQNERMLRRFLREARAVSAVNHPNVVQVHDVLQLPDGSPVMVLDLLKGEDLGQKLEREKRIQLPDLARLIVPVLSAVGTAHEAGIVHRDLKPDNIFLHLRADNVVEPRVLDFGIAKLNAKTGDAAETAHLTQTGSVMGTPYYMPPEQVYGERDIDQRADVWSMGVILYECLSGVKPVNGENFGQLFKAITQGNITPLEEVAPFLPQEVVDLVHRMLEPDRNARCYDLRDAYEVLNQYTDATARDFGSAASLADFQTREGTSSEPSPAAPANSTPANSAPANAVPSQTMPLASAVESGAGGTKELTAVTEPAAPLLEKSSSVEGLSRSSISHPPQSSQRPRPLVWGAVGLAVGGLALGGWLITRSSEVSSSAGSTDATPSVAASASPTAVPEDEALGAAPEHASDEPALTPSASAKPAAEQAPRAQTPRPARQAATEASLTPAPAAQPKPAAEPAPTAAPQPKDERKKGEILEPVPF